MKRFSALFLLFFIALFHAPAGALALSQGMEVYLTFDDGPSREHTPAVLDTLRRHGVKATFFVVGKSIRANRDIIARMRREGHTVGAHCDEHVYEKVYKSHQTFKADLRKCVETIERALPGYKVRFYRFPGGSFGKSERIKSIVKDMGLEIIDWNCVNGDTEIKDAREGEILSAVKSTSRGKKKAVILMHDNKKITAQTLDAVIKFFKEKGYTFKKFV